MSRCVITMTCGMGRWEPDARGRLGQAAMELYAERGYEQTTVAEIAERAGLTARTFFRYFADKREVLFAGSEALGEQLVDGARRRPRLGHAARRRGRRRSARSPTCIGDDRDFSRRAPGGHRRQRRAAGARADQARRVVGRARGRAARAAASTSRPRASPPRPAIAVFRVAFERWLADPGDRSLADTLRDSFDQLGAVIAGG